MRNLNVRGCETEAIDRTFLCKLLAHHRGWCLTDGSLEEERHLDVWENGLILAQRESRSVWNPVYIVYGCFHAVRYAPYPRKHKC